MSTRNHYTSHVATADISLWQQLLAFLAPLFAFFGVDYSKAAPQAGDLSEEHIRQIWDQMPLAKQRLISNLEFATDKLTQLYGPFLEKQYRLLPGVSLPERFHKLATALIRRDLKPVRIHEPPAPRICARTGETLPDLPRSTYWLIETYTGEGQVEDRLVTEAQLRKEIKSLIKWLCRVKLNTKARTVRPLYRG
jgi:hypothetical protein